MLHVWIDQDLCTGDGLCTDHCPELFVLLEDGISYVRMDGEPQNDPGGVGSMAPVVPELVEAAVAAAEDCPGECIFLEDLPVGTPQGPMRSEPAIS
jgi:ferredoxin